MPGPRLPSPAGPDLPATPCRTESLRAAPVHAQPSRVCHAPPRPAEPYRALPNRGTPCQAPPRRCLPSQAVPRRASLAEPHLDIPGPAIPGRTAPHRTPAHPAKPGRPSLAMPTQALICHPVADPAEPNRPEARLVCPAMSNRAMHCRPNPRRALPRPTFASQRQPRALVLRRWRTAPPPTLAPGAPGRDHFRRRARLEASVERGPSLLPSSSHPARLPRRAGSATGAVGVTTTTLAASTASTICANS